MEGFHERVFSSDPLSLQKVRAPVFDFPIAIVWYYSFDILTAIMVSVSRLTVNARREEQQGTPR
jgi:hypothetical protein